MEYILSFFSVLFIGLVITCALALGFTILIWIIAAGIALTVYLKFREVMQRWLFLRNANKKPHTPSLTIIDADYRDITDDKP